MIYWKRLLIEWRKQGRDGLTITFLVGSQKYLRSDGVPDTIKDLIEDIAYSDIEIYITYCMDINDLILGVRDDSKSKIAGEFIIENNQRTNLFITKGVADLGNDLESLIESLIDRYQDDLDAGNYSRNNFELGDYSLREVAFITNCFD